MITGPPLSGGDKQKTLRDASRCRSSYDELMALKNLGTEIRLRRSEVMLYAYGIGMGADHGRQGTGLLNERSPRRGRESGPTFPRVAAWAQAPNESQPRDGGRCERDITFHKPLAIAARITADSTVLDVFDKGQDKGPVIRHQTVSGTSRVRNWRRWSPPVRPRTALFWRVLWRANPNRSKVADPQPRQINRYFHAPDQALVLPALGDRNPFTDDPEFAKSAPDFPEADPARHVHLRITCRASCRPTPTTILGFRQHGRSFLLAGLSRRDR